MEQQKEPTSPPGLSGVIPMVRIDGGKIRHLRESRGLTQLYLSTVVGVTTDTISRWENRHYQSIKLENAEKVAEALEVPLAEILEQPGQSPEPAPPLHDGTHATEVIGPGGIAPPTAWRNLNVLLPAVLVLAAAVAGLLFYLLVPRQPRGILSAERILPSQAPSGQVFPVLVRVSSAVPEAMSLILKEKLPAGSTSSQSVPQPTTVDRKDNSLKWIGRAEAGESLFAYLCQVPSGASHGEILTFSGTVTRKQTLGEQEAVAGASTLAVAPFHWADRNRDQVIDDEEILAVYDLYSDIQGLDFDRDRIDSLWAAGGYRWDEKKKTYLVHVQAPARKEGE